MGVSAAIGAVALAGTIYSASQAHQARQAAKDQAFVQSQSQLKLEKNLKNKQINDQNLDNSKALRARLQDLSAGPATKNGTIQTTALGVQNSGGATKTLLGE